jgi:hypothetical protein
MIRRGKGVANNKLPMPLLHDCGADPRFSEENFRAGRCVGEASLSDLSTSVRDVYDCFHTTS